MDKELKDKWVKALRSGKYKQGRGSLRCSTADEDRFCCLGVLCDVVDNRRWNDFHGGTYSYGDSTTYLPGSISRQADVGYNLQETLTGLNDTLEKSFNEIADYIEKNL